MDVSTYPAASARFLGQAVELSRAFRQPAEKVWAALTLPARITEWMGADWLGDPAPLQEGSAFNIRFRDTGMESQGRVLRCEPFTLEYSWFENLAPGGVVTWHLTPAAAGCRLTLKQIFPTPEDAPRQAAGWACLLQRLAEAAGEPVAAPQSLEDWRGLRDGFAATFPPQATRDGRRSTSNGHPSLRFERLLNHDCASAWTALVSPEAIARWFQADAVVDPVQGGRFHLAFHAFNHAMNGQITRWEPPHLLEFTWPEAAAQGDSLVRFELTPTQAGCRLVLTHEFHAGGEMADFASGWHWHLDALEPALLGEAILFDQARWGVLRKVYQATL